MKDKEIIIKGDRALVSYRQLAKALDVPWGTFAQWSNRFFGEGTLKGKEITINKSSPEALAMMFAVKQLRGFWKCPIGLVEEILGQLEVAFKDPETAKGEKKIALLVIQAHQAGNIHTLVNVVVDTEEALAKTANTFGNLGHVTRLHDISETVRQIREEGALNGIGKAMRDALSG